MFTLIESIAGEGKYEEAYETARKEVQKLLKENKRAEAALSLGHSAYILCNLNNPSKAISFAHEASDIGRKESHPLAQGFAEMVRALAHLRMGQFDRARSCHERASVLIRETEGEYASLGRILCAEVALANEEFDESISFAEEAFTMAAALENPIDHTVRVTLWRPRSKG